MTKKEQRERAKEILSRGTHRNKVGYNMDDIFEPDLLKKK